MDRIRICKTARCGCDDVCAIPWDIRMTVRIHRTGNRALEKTIGVGHCICIFAISMSTHCELEANTTSVYIWLHFWVSLRKKHSTTCNIEWEIWSSNGNSWKNQQAKQIKCNKFIPCNFLGTLALSNEMHLLKWNGNKCLCQGINNNVRPNG